MADWFGLTYRLVWSLSTSPLLCATIVFLEEQNSIRTGLPPPLSPHFCHPNCSTQRNLLKRSIKSSHLFIKTLLILPRVNSKSFTLTYITDTCLPRQFQLSFRQAISFLALECNKLLTPLVSTYVHSLTRMLFSPTSVFWAIRHLFFYSFICSFIYSVIQCFSTGGNFAPHGTYGNVWRHL